MDINNIAKPTPQQLLWQEYEFGVLIHYLADIYAPDMPPHEIKTRKVREALHPSKINPSNLNPEQWVRSAWEAGAKYAILVANHCSGFSLWQTKVNDYCTRSLAWKNGKGDIVKDFIEACKKYGLKPGLYYSTAVNGYYDISDEVPHDYNAPYYREYIRNVEEQVTELWSEYGKLFEIWFDGGIIPAEKGGPNIAEILKKYQPDALCFQGPSVHPHNLRWVGNEEGLAPENCWATISGNDSDSAEESINVSSGNPDGDCYCPAETDTPNRSCNSFGGGWAWKEGEKNSVRSPEELLDCYVKSVGRNSNLLLGMAISASGQFEDEEQFIAFGKLIKKTFGTPIAKITCQNEKSNIISLKTPENQASKYIVLRENIENGQHIRKFRVMINGLQVYESACIGHKRIIPISIPVNSSVTVEIAEAYDGWQLIDVSIY